MKKLSHAVQHELLEIGIPANLLGFSYLAYAEELVFTDPNYMHQITDWLYVDVAKHFHTKPRCVERCIRHAIVAAWLHGNVDYRTAIFRHSVRPSKGVPTNSQFIAGVYFYMLEKREDENEKEC